MEHQKVLREDNTLNYLSCVLLLKKNKVEAKDYFNRVIVEKVCHNEHFQSEEKPGIVKACEEFLPKCGPFFWDRILYPEKFKLKKPNIKVINGNIYSVENNQYVLLLICPSVKEPQKRKRILFNLKKWCTTCCDQE